MQGKVITFLAAGISDDNFPQKVRETYFATKERHWFFQANIMMDLDMQKSIFIFMIMIMIMIYELLRKILGKVRKIMKKN